MPDWPVFPNVSGALRSSANQTFQTGIATLCTLDTLIRDTGGMAVQTTTNLTGTLAKTSGSNAIVGTSTLFTTELAVGDWIDVPGTVTERRRVATITDNTHLTVTGNYNNSASGQTGVKVNYGLKATQAGIYVISEQFNFDSGTTGNRELQTLLNGASLTLPTSPTGATRVVASSEGTRATSAPQLQLARNDVIGIAVKQTQAADISAGFGYLSMTYLCPG